MLEMVFNIIIAALAVYGLTCLIRCLWLWVIKKEKTDNILIVPLNDDNLEFSLREAVALSKVISIKKIAAVDCDLSSESRQMALMFANSEPLVKIVDSDDKIYNIIK